MTSLSQSLRDTICITAVNASFEKRKNDLDKREHVIALKCYNDVFKKITRDLAATLATGEGGWLRMDSCLRFNIDGMYITLCVEKPLPVPHCHGYSNLGTPGTKALRDEAVEHAREKDRLKNDYGRAKTELAALLKSCRTFKVLEKAWPQGRQFYERYNVGEVRSGLPAIQVESLNKLMGLK